jgi:DNA-directed RNA polymerase subunit RPC12/RpoP
MATSAESADRDGGDGRSFKYVHAGMVGERDTRHEAVGDLVKHGDWQSGGVVAISEDCLVRWQDNGPVHLGDKHYGDRDYLPTKHGAVRLNTESLVRFVNGNEQETVETEWYADCPICGRRVSVDGAGEAARSDLITKVLNHCGSEWFPPSDWMEDCDICGEDHRESHGCRPPAARSPFPGVDQHYDCADCGWDGHGEELRGPEGECPDCDSPAVLVVDLSNDSKSEQPGGGGGE